MACSKSDAAQTTGNRKMLVEVSRVSKHLSRHGEQKLHHLVECLKQHLNNKCLAVVQTSQGMPVQSSHSADATTLKCSTTAVVSSGGASLTRKGKLLHELLGTEGGSHDQSCRQQCLDGFPVLRCRANVSWKGIVELFFGRCDVLPASSENGTQRYMCAAPLCRQSSARRTDRGTKRITHQAWAQTWAQRVPS